MWLQIILAKCITRGLNYRLVNIRRYVGRSLNLLTSREQRKFQLFLVLQFFNAILDICGVLLIGLLILEVQNVGVSTDSSTSKFLRTLLPSSSLGLSESSSSFLLLVLSLFCFFIKAITAPLLQRNLLIFLGRIAINYSDKIMSKLFSRDIIFIQKRSTQEIALIITSSSFLSFQGVLGFFVLMVSEFMLIILILIMLLAINLYLTLFIIFYFSSILYLLNQFSRRVVEKNSLILNDANVSARTQVQESLNSYREVFISQKINEVTKSMIDSLRDITTARANLTWIGLLPKYVFDLTIVFGIALVAGVSYLVYSGEETLTLIGLFILCAYRIMPSILRFNTGLHGIQNCSDDSNRFNNLIRELADSESEYAQGKILLQPRTVGQSLIEVNSLYFKYQDATEMVLEDLSFSVKKGEFLAIVGPSGAGKSTLVDLLIGVINDSTGSIRIGGVTPREKIQSSPKLIGYVPQDTSLLTRTLLENIALGVPLSEVDHARVAQVVKRSALDDLVKSLPVGLETLVGENGYNFSGGQRQRIGLARAFYGNPEILILDEATSALDAETEHQISQALSSLAGELTLIVVAHRLATVQNADRVLYLGGAGISEEGSFEELRIKVPNFDVQAKLLGL